MEINKLFSTSGAQDIFLWEWKCGAVDYNCISTTLKELTNAYIVIEAGPKIDSPKSGISPLLDNVILNQLLKTISEIHLRPHTQQILGESVNSNTCFAKAKYSEIRQFSVHIFFSPILKPKLFCGIYSKEYCFLPTYAWLYTGSGTKLNTWNLPQPMLSGKSVASFLFYSFESTCFVSGCSWVNCLSTKHHQEGLISGSGLNE